MKKVGINNNMEMESDFILLRKSKFQNSRALTHSKYHLTIKQES